MTYEPAPPGSSWCFGDLAFGGVGVLPMWRNGREESERGGKLARSTQLGKFGTLFCAEVATLVLPYVRNYLFNVQNSLIMKKEHSDLHAGYHHPARPLDAKVPTKITLDGDTAIRLAEMARKNDCSKSDIVNILVGRYPNPDNVVSEIVEYTALGCLEWD